MRALRRAAPGGDASGRALLLQALPAGRLAHAAERPQATAQLPEDLGPAHHVPRSGRQQNVVGPAGRMTTRPASVPREQLSLPGVHK